MRPSLLHWTAPAARAGLLATALLLAGPARAEPYAESFNQLYGPGHAVPFPGCCTWNADTIGWYWTPAQTFDLVRIQTILIGGLFGVNNNVDLTVKLFTERPAAGGQELASATFNAGAFLAADPSWHGQDFAMPVRVLAGTSYFVGFQGWDGPYAEPGRGGINWVVQPDFAPSFLPPGVQLFSAAWIGAAFDQKLAEPPATTSAPVIKFVGTTVSPVPEPGTWALWLAGLAAVGAAARRPRRA